MFFVFYFISVLGVGISLADHLLDTFDVYLTSGSQLAERASLSLQALSRGESCKKSVSRVVYVSTLLYRLDGPLIQRLIFYLFLLNFDSRPLSKFDAYSSFEEVIASRDGSQHAYNLKRDAKLHEIVKTVLPISCDHQIRLVRDGGGVRS